MPVELGSDDLGLLCLVAVAAGLRGTYWGMFASACTHETLIAAVGRTLPLLPAVTLAEVREMLNTHWWNPNEYQQPAWRGLTEAVVEEVRRRAGPGTHVVTEDDGEIEAPGL